MLISYKVVRLFVNAKLCICLWFQSKKMNVDADINAAIDKELNALSDASLEELDSDESDVEIEFADKSFCNPTFHNGKLTALPKSY